MRPGIDVFHKRLRFELRDDLAHTAHFMEVQPEWPMDLYDQDRSFTDMMAEAFEVHSLKDIPRSIRKYARGITGQQSLVYIRHAPVRSKRIMNPDTLKDYLIWWERNFVPLLQDRVYALLTVSFEVDNPARFQSYIKKRNY